MNKRQEHALAHPLGRADGDPRRDLIPLRTERRHATGLLIRTILAVDR